MRRTLPALGLFLLAPIVAEFLLGNLPITALVSLVVLAPMYGGGAVLIRESVRHTGRGWPSVLVLALAYGVLEEGIATMSLFNPNYAGLRLLDYGHVSWLGIGVPWTVLMLTLHVVWSISVPIATAEAVAYTRRTTPWLGRLGLSLTALVFVAGVAATTAFSIAQSGYVASLPQLIAVGAIVAGLAVVALVLMPRQQVRRPTGAVHAPSPWLVGLAALVVSSAFKLLPLDWAPWLYVSLALGLALLAMFAVRLWSHRRGWGDIHRLALAAGALFTYAWTAFPQTPVLPASPEADLVGNTIFAVGALALVAVAAARLHSTSAGAADATHVSRAAADAQGVTARVD